MRKKILAAMMAATVLALTACGNQAGQETAEGTVQETEAAETTDTETETGTGENTVEGMVVEAAMNSLTVLTLSGEYELFSYPENGAETNLENGILLGEIVKVEYTGSSENGDAVAQNISEGSIETTLPREAYEFALTVLESVKLNDMEGLSACISYPSYIGMGEEDTVVETKEDFMAIDREKMTPLYDIAEFNLFNMTESQAGIIIGDSKPNIIFKETDGSYGITGINMPAAE